MSTPAAQPTGGPSVKFVLFAIRNSAGESAAISDDDAAPAENGAKGARAALKNKVITEHPDFEDTPQQESIAPRGITSP